jgi:hypothetical protein
MGICRVGSSDMHCNGLYACDKRKTKYFEASGSLILLQPQSKQKMGYF